MGPSEDVAPGVYHGNRFALIHDLDYGASIWCESTAALEALIGILEA